MIGYSILGTFGAYVFTSVVLLKFPHILHTKKKRHFYCSHISHRGGAAERCENTLPAFYNAKACQTHMFELDVHLSKDKKVVVVHDADLKRVTDVDGKVCDYNYKELPTLKNTIEVTFSKDLVCKSQETEARMPLLEDIFINFPNMPVNLDIKDNDDELIEQTVQLVEKYQRENLVIWGNNNSVVVDKLYEKNPNVAVFFSLRRVLLLLVWFYTGLLPFVPLKERFFDVPLIDCFSKMRTEPTRMQKFLISIVDFIFTSKVLIAHLRKRGIPTYFWVLNDEEDFQKAFDLGAEGVMTDCPTKLREWLNEHVQYDITKTAQIDSNEKSKIIHS